MQRITFSRKAYDHLVEVLPRPDAVQVVEQNDEAVTIEGTADDLAAWFTEARSKIQ